MVLMDNRPAVADESAMVAQMLQLLRTHPLVGLAEPHQSVPFHAFLHALIHSHDSPMSVSTVVVEFGNAGTSHLSMHISPEKTSRWRGSSMLGAIPPNFSCGTHRCTESFFKRSAA